MSIHKITQDTRTTRALEVFENIGDIEVIPLFEHASTEPEAGQSNDGLAE